MNEKDNKQIVRLKRLDGTLIAEYIIERIIPSSNGIWESISYRRVNEKLGGDIEKLIYQKENGLNLEIIDNTHSDYWIIDSFLSKYEKSPGQKFEEFLERMKKAS